MGAAGGRREADGVVGPVMERVAPVGPGKVERDMN